MTGVCSTGERPGLETQTGAQRWGAGEPSTGTDVSFASSHSVGSGADPKAKAPSRRACCFSAGPWAFWGWAILGYCHTAGHWRDQSLKPHDLVSRACLTDTLSTGQLLRIQWIITWKTALCLEYAHKRQVIYNQRGLLRPNTSGYQSQVHRPLRSPPPSIENLTLSDQASLCLLSTPTKTRWNSLLSASNPKAAKRAQNNVLGYLFQKVFHQRFLKSHTRVSHKTSKKLF